MILRRNPLAGASGSYQSSAIQASGALASLHPQYPPAECLQVDRRLATGRLDDPSRDQILQSAIPPASTADRHREVTRPPRTVEDDEDAVLARCPQERIDRIPGDDLAKSAPPQRRLAS